MVKRSCITETVQQHITDPQLAQEVLSRHQGTRITVSLDSQEFTAQTTEGVPQGDPLAPITFVNTYEGMQRSMDLQNPPSTKFAYTVPMWIPGLRHYPVPFIYVHKEVFVDDYLEINEFTHKKDITQQLQSQIKHQAQWGVNENP